MIFVQIISFLIVVVLIFLLAKKKHSVYKYSVKEDYDYDFTCASKTLELSLDHNTLRSLDFSETYDTAMMEVEIKATLFGHIKQPFITMIQGDMKYRQYFEYGAKGKRYLNVSHCFKGNVDLKFKMNTCKIINTKVKLFLFNNEINLNENICIIAPHPDDAEIAAYGLYSSCNNPHILTVSAAESGKQMYKELDIDATGQAILKGKTRTINSISVPLLAGVDAKNCLNYGYFGDTVKSMYDNQGSLVKSQVEENLDMSVFRKLNGNNKLLNVGYSPKWSSLVNDLKFSLEQIQPKVIILPFPEIDTHPDHKYSTVAVIEAMKLLCMTDVKLLLYTNHHVLSEAYPYGKVSSNISLPPNFSQELLFDSLYSFELDKNKQVEKTIALEGMNVLRAFYPWHKDTTILNRVFKNLVNKLYGKRLDYFSRSIRSNELFFLIEGKNIDKLLLSL